MVKAPNSVSSSLCGEMKSSRLTRASENLPGEVIRYMLNLRRKHQFWWRAVMVRPSSGAPEIPLRVFRSEVELVDKEPAINSDAMINPMSCLSRRYTPSLSLIL